MSGILRVVEWYLRLVRANIRGWRGYFMDEIVVVNIRDFDISCLIDLGVDRWDLTWYNIAYGIGML